MRRHGIPSTYAHGCRCDVCRAAWTEYRRPRVKAYRARKRADTEAERRSGALG